MFVTATCGAGFDGVAVVDGRGVVGFVADGAEGPVGVDLVSLSVVLMDDLDTVLLGDAVELVVVGAGLVTAGD